MANEPLTYEQLFEGVLKLRLERDTAIDLLRRLVATWDASTEENPIRPVQWVEAARTLLAAIDGEAPVPAGPVEEQ